MEKETKIHLTKKIIMAFVSNARFTLRCMISSGLFIYVYNFCVSSKVYRFYRISPRLKSQHTWGVCQVLGQQSLPSPVALPPNCWVSSRFSLCNIQLVLQWHLKTEIRIGNEWSTCRSWSKSWLLFLGYCRHKSLISGGASGSCFSARSAHEKVYLGGVSNPYN